MKNLALIVVFIFGAVLNSTAQNEIKEASTVKTISLAQAPGEFTQQNLTLSEGTYIFQIKNNNVGHDVGFVLAPKKSPNQHIKTAYVTKAVANNQTQTSNPTTLTKGEYVYFCPMNPTPQYTLTVE